MRKLEFITGLHLNDDRMISCQLADQILPLYLDEGDILERRKTLITLYIAYFEMIMKLGEHEHTNDWDPAAKIILNDGTIIGDEAGFNVMEIINNALILECPNEDGEYKEEYGYSIDINTIKSIQYNFH